MSSEFRINSHYFGIIVLRPIDEHPVKGVVKSRLITDFRRGGLPIQTAVL
jgi:hypothetical protein